METVSSTDGAGKTGQLHVKKKKVRYSLTPHIKISSKWIEELNAKPNNIKLLEESIGRTLSDINHSNIFFNPSLLNNENKNK